MSGPLSCLAGRLQAPSGILNLNKPQGFTSHDVVQQVRRLIRQTGLRCKAGHAGTLDPLATGVLLICLNQATRVVEYLVGHDKVYRARLRLGQITDTFDAEGQIVEERIPKHWPDVETVVRALQSFRGEIEQVPPAFSAIKQAGRPAYRRARQGEEVVLEARRVTVHELDLLRLSPPELELRIVCSAGTYVRSLAHDLGRALGCGAHLVALVREASGPFQLQDALTLEQLAAAVKNGAWEQWLHPIDLALQHLPELQLTAQEAWRVAQGQALFINDRLPVSETEVRAYTLDGLFVAVLLSDPEAGLRRPRKVFVEPDAIPAWR